MQSSMISVLVFMLLSSRCEAQTKGVEEIADLSRHQPLDVVVILDDSDSVKDEDFVRMINVTRLLPDHITIAPESSNVAVIVYSDESRIEIPLTDDPSRLWRMPYPGRQKQNTRTHLALEQAKNEVFKSGRDGVQKVVILITDGEPNTPWVHPNYAPTEQAAEQLRNDGVLIFTVVVGDFYNKEEVKKHFSNSSAVERIESTPSKTSPVSRPASSARSTTTPTAASRTPASSRSTERARQSTGDRPTKRKTAPM